MKNKIDLTWEFFNTKKDVEKEFDKVDKAVEDIEEETKLKNVFEENFKPFENDDKLKWDENQPLIIKRKVRIDSTKEIKDITIDDEISIIKSYDEYMQNEDNFDYTMLDEIINITKSVLIDSYENLIPFNFNELVTTFVGEDDNEFGFDLYQLNATGSSDGEVFIIDAKSVEKNNVFESIKEDFETRVKVVN